MHISTRDKYKATLLVKNFKQPKSPSTGEEIYKLCFIYIIEYEEKINLLHKTIWMSLIDIMSEKGQTGDIAV